MEPARPTGDPAALSSLPRPLSPPRAAERHAHSLLALVELSHELGVALDPFAIADLVLLNLMGHFGTSKAVLWILPGEQARDLALMRAHGLREVVARALGGALGPALRTPAFRHEPTPAPVAAWEAVLPAGAGLAAASGLELLVPVVARGRALGVLAMGPRVSGEPYAGLDLEYAGAAARLTGVALENARLYHRVLEANRTLRESNQRLQELDRLKAEFVQNVNHEMRTPLAVIQGYLEMLVEDPALGAMQRGAMVAALTQTCRLGRMVLDLLEFSAVADQDEDPQIETVDLRTLLERFAADRRPGVVAGLRGFTLQLADDLPQAHADARALRRVLDALVDNAVKFTPPGSQVTLRGASRVEDGAWAVVEVTDDGPGVEAEQLRALFEPFRQLDGSTTRRAGGMGLGLALARGLAERMGGRLEAESIPGAGITFRVWLRAA